MKVAFYARVSTERQADKNLSIPAQLGLMRDHAQRQNWDIVEEFIEPGMTATNANRPVLQEILRRVQDKTLQVDVLLAHKLNRMARNVDDYAPIRRVLQDSGVRLAYVVEHVDGSASGRLLENVMASVAEFESANLSDETKKGMRQKVLQGGWPHRPPRGYVSVKRSGNESKGSRCEIQPREGPFITRAFTLFMTGKFSVKSVARILADQGMVSSRGTPLSFSHMRRILTNPFYTGRIVWQGLDVQGQHTPLVDLATFETVRKLVRERATKPIIRASLAGFPLRGIAVCARCRGHLTGERHGRWSYYRCSRRTYDKNACDSRFVRTDRVHRDVEGVLQSLQITRATADEIYAAADRLINHRAATADRQRISLGRKQIRITATEHNLANIFLSGHLVSTDYRHKIEELRTEKTLIATTIRTLNMPAEVLRARVTQSLELSTALVDLYRPMNDQRRAEFLSGIFSAVIVGADGLVGFNLRPPFDRLQSGPSVDSRAAALLEDDNFQPVA